MKSSETLWKEAADRLRDLDREVLDTRARLGMLEAIRQHERWMSGRDTAPPPAGYPGGFR